MLLIIKNRVKIILDAMGQIHSSDESHFKLSQFLGQFRKCTQAGAWVQVKNY